MILVDTLNLIPTQGFLLSCDCGETSDLSKREVDKRLRELRLTKKDIDLLPSTGRETLSNQTLLGSTATAAAKPTRQRKKRQLI